jgi:hypothetical protein
MNRLPVFLLLGCAVVCFAQSPRIQKDSTIYIEPMGGYETYLAAALVKKHVPLVVVTKKDKAEYIIKSNLSHKSMDSGQPSVVVNNRATSVINGNANESDSPFTAGAMAGERQGAAERAALGETSAGIEVVDVHSSQIVFAYAADRMGAKQMQKTAEDCAKHLKEFIEKPTKEK